MPTPTDVLREEHRFILRALDLVDAAADRSAGPEPAAEAWWAAALDWLRDFADRTHHAREERALFPAMVKAGIPAEGGPVGVMLAEHDLGRQLIAAMASPAGPADRAAAARRYTALLRAHIAKENDVLFPLADAVLDGDVQASLAGEFEALTALAGRDGDLDHAGGVLDRLAIDVGPQP